MKGPDMDFLRPAFGGLNPQTDQDAAVKLALNSILMDDRLQELSYLLTDDHEIGGIEGEPGWLIERKDTGSSAISYYAEWPKNTSFHVRVEPTAFELAYPDIFMSTSDFYHYVQMAIEAYLISDSTSKRIACKINLQIKNTANAR